MLTGKHTTHLPTLTLSFKLNKIPWELLSPFLTERFPTTLCSSFRGWRKLHLAGESLKLNFMLQSFFFFNLMFQSTHWSFLSQGNKSQFLFHISCCKKHCVCSNGRFAIYLFCFAFNQPSKNAYYSPWCQYYAIVSSCHSFQILTSCRLSSLCDPPPAPKPCHVIHASAAHESKVHNT